MTMTKLETCYATLRVLVTCICLAVAETVDFSNMTRRQVVSTLLNYHKNDPRIPPDYDKDVPTNVSVQMHIVSFHSVNEVSMIRTRASWASGPVGQRLSQWASAYFKLDFTMTFYLRRRWVDERLAFPSFPISNVLELDNRLLDKLWVPDIFFRNEKTAVVHNVTVPNRLIHIYRNGTVMYSSRMSMTLSCPMDLLLFPLDIQACPVIIQSYAYSTSNVNFYWMEGDSITKADNWEMAHFIDHGIDTTTCSHLFDYQFACVMAIFRLQRHLGYFLVHVYLPTVMVVILSWVSFWIDAGATPARITIGVMSILTMATQSSGSQTFLPRVSYVKAIDVWMATCVCFVFASLLEFAYVNVLNRRKNLTLAFMRGLKKRTQASRVAAHTDQQAEQQGVTVEPPTIKYMGPDPRRVDKISRVVFPSLFIIFVITYWTVYMVLSLNQATLQKNYILT